MWWQVWRTFNVFQRILHIFDGEFKGFIEFYNGCERTEQLGRDQLQCYSNDYTADTIRSTVRRRAKDILFLTALEVSSARNALLLTYLLARTTIRSASVRAKTLMIMQGRVHIGVGAQSTLGVHDIFAWKICLKINKLPEFYMILARKISKIPEFL